MPKKHRTFADDGWAVWVDGEDTSTFFINDWLNPKGNSYVDISMHIRGVKSSKMLNVYVPFAVSADEIEDVSIKFRNRKILQAVFNAAGIVDFMKNAHTSEVAFNGKTMDVVHISTLEYQIKALPSGTLICIDLEKLQPFLDNDESYFIWRMPHRSLNEVFRPRVNVGSMLDQLRNLITTPVISEKYGYSIRVNEARLLPEEITRIGAFYRQKLKKTVITLSIDESFELNDANCYRIRRMEENLFREYLPADYPCEDVIIYQWNQNRLEELQGHFNFYYGISQDYVSRGSMLLYMTLILAIGVLGDYISKGVQALVNHNGIMDFMGYSFEVANNFWNMSLKLYLGTEDEAVCRSVAEKAMVIGYVSLLRRALRRPNEAESPARIARCKEMLGVLLNKLDSLEF